MTQNLTTKMSAHQLLWTVDIIYTHQLQHGINRYNLSTIRTVAASVRYASLKQPQGSTLEASVNSRDMFVSLPTGSGKSSLCFELLPHVLDFFRGWNIEKVSIAIVVSPPLSLMKDQTVTFNQMGVLSFCVRYLQRIEATNLMRTVSLLAQSLSFVIWCGGECCLQASAQIFGPFYGVRGPLH